jgi:hypothetical protein
MTMVQRLGWQQKKMMREEMMREEVVRVPNLGTKNSKIIEILRAPYSGAPRFPFKMRYVEIKLLETLGKNNNSNGYLRSAAFFFYSFS